MILTTRDANGPPIDMTGVLPTNVRADTPVIRGRERFGVGDLFTLEAGGAPDTLVLHPNGAVLDGVGAGMAAGEIRVVGDCGACAGRGMRGGTLIIEGKCGAFAAAGMAGGRMRIAGDAGDFLGAPLAGSPRGMSGGSVTVGGGAGDRAGERMRRGLIAVAGRVGSLCGARMIAGTIIIGGGCGPELGLAMRRGTILLSRMPEPNPAGFVGGDAVNEWLFLELLRRDLIVAGAWPAGFPAQGTRARRLLGDRSVGGIGEVLILPEG